MYISTLDTWKGYISQHGVTPPMIRVGLYSA